MISDHQRETARACLSGALDGSMTFPAAVASLMEAGFESYAIDFRRATATYYLADGDSVELPMHPLGAPVAPSLDAAAMRAAIREAQQSAPGYTYRGFCDKAAKAGCAFYVVSFSGRRALYLGRKAETHVEHFPD